MLFFSFPLIIAVPYSRPMRIIPSRLLPMLLPPPPPSTNSTAPHVLPPAIGDHYPDVTLGATRVLPPAIGGTLQCLFVPPPLRPPKTERGRMTWYSFASLFILHA